MNPWMAECSLRAYFRAVVSSPPILPTSSIRASDVEQEDVILGALINLLVPYLRRCPRRSLIGAQKAHQHVHSFNQPSICSFTQLARNLFIHSITHSCIHVFIQSINGALSHSFIHVFIHSINHAGSHSFNQPCMHSRIHSLNQPYVYSFTQSAIHGFIYSRIHSLNQPCMYSFTQSAI